MMQRQRIPKMWPERRYLPKVSIRTVQMFGRLSELFGRFIDFEDSLFYTVSVIYVLLTYLYDIFDEIPYLQVFGLKGSGKTRYGDLLEGLCFNPFSSSEISEASLYRVIGQEYGGVTMIIDEADSLSGSTRHGILLRILRSGYRRNGNVTRCGTGRGIERFSTFCPKIIINEGGIHDSALESRTIPIHMIKSTRPLEKFQFSKVEKEFREVRNLIRQFSEDYRNLVLDRYASFKGIDGMSGRDEEVWAPILIIAETLDGARGNPSIKESIQTLAKEIILQRKRTLLIGNVEAQILEATRAYMMQAEPIVIDGVHFYVGEDLGRSIKDRCSLSGLKIETISRILKRNGIILDVKRPRLPNKGQRSCYVLDRERLLKITAEYF